MTRNILLAVMLPLFVACNSIDKNSSPPLMPHHTLVGQIWDLRTQQAITQNDFLQQVAKAEYLLLGESHDNEHHHRIQVEVLRSLLSRSIRPAVAMEQFDTDHQGAINTSQAKSDASAESVADAGQFDRAGWKWHLYEPIVTLAVQSRLSIIGVNLSRPAARKIVKQGLTPPLNDAYFDQLAFSAGWNQKRNDTLERSVIEGHCGSVPKGLLPKLVLAQRARDSIMADALIHKTQNHVVTILGREHARKDIGVPIYLIARVPNAVVISVALVEVEKDRINPSDYFALDATMHFDFIWFTPSIERDDPCTLFRSSAYR